jgi:methionine aminotransferase
MKIKSKLPNVGTTIFTVMSALANQHKAINLSQGFPDFPIDDTFKAILEKSLEEDVHQYAPMMGLPKLREEIIEIIQKHHNRQLQLEEVLITAGATQAIFTSIQALVGKDDEIIIIDPAYDCYAPAVDLVGGKRIHIPLNEQMELDLYRIKNALNSKTRMLILNNPHNPTGTVFSKNALAQLVELLIPYPDCIILSDEVYEFINFTTDEISMHQFKAIHERLITISSFGKTLHVTGWKIGYLCAPLHLMKEITKVHQFLVFSVNHYAQLAIATYLKVCDIHAISPLFQRKRDLLRDLLAGSKFKLLPCHGTYFQLIDYSRISDEPDLDFAKKLIREHGVATIPISVFFNSQFEKKYLRLCFAKSDSTLTSAAEKLCAI